MANPEDCIRRSIRGLIIIWEFHLRSYLNTNVCGIVVLFTSRKDGNLQQVFGGDLKYDEKRT